MSIKWSLWLGTSKQLLPTKFVIDDCDENAVGNTCVGLPLVDRLGGAALQPTIRGVINMQAPTSMCRIRWRCFFLVIDRFARVSNSLIYSPRTNASEPELQLAAPGSVTIKNLLNQQSPAAFTRSRTGFRHIVLPEP